MNELYSDYDGNPVEQASDLNYFTKDNCDGCGNFKYGMMIHAAGATGRCCPVLFLCGLCRGEKIDDVEDSEEDYDESMDGDHDSAMASAGWGTDEDYGYFGD
jgi:hypothetical protein